MSSRKLFTVTSIISVAILALELPELSWISQSFSYDLKHGFLSPAFFTIVSYAISSLILLFFGQDIFKLWLRKIVSWFFPLSIIILFAADPASSGIISFDRTDYAIGLGFLLVSITLIFALLKRFYSFIKVRNKILKALLILFIYSGGLLICFNLIQIIF
jgi:hypothetical protein